MLSGLVFVPLAVAVSGLAYFHAYGPISPGVYAAGVQLGGLTVEQAATELHRVWNLEHKIKVTNGRSTFYLSPAELGLQLDVLAVAEAAYAAGRQGSLFANVETLLRTADAGLEVMPVVAFNPAVARQGLESLVPSASLAPRNASLHLEGDRLVSSPAEFGYTIDIENSLAVLEAEPLQALFGGMFVITMQTVAPEVSDVSSALAEAEALLEMTVTVQAYDPITNESLEWTLARAELISWLSVGVDGSGSPVVSLDAGRYLPYLNSLSASLSPSRSLDLSSQAAPSLEDLRAGRLPLYQVVHAPTSYTVQAGDTLISIAWKVGLPYWKLIEANPDMDPDILRAGQTLVVPSKDEMLPYPVVMNKRIVVSIDRQRMWLYENGSQVAEYVVSTGIASSPTQPGVFQIRTHEREAYASVWDLYMPNFLGIYEAWPGFMNGIHGLPTLSNGQRLWANVLGRPASYGCIILDLPSAQALFDWAEQGVVIEIRP